MSALDDLKAANAAIASAVAAAVQDIQDLAAVIKQDSVSDADAEDVANQLNTLATNLQAAVDASKPPAPAQ